MNIIEFINKLKINNNDFMSNNILFFLGNLDKFNIKRIIQKPLYKFIKGGSSLSKDSNIALLGNGDGKGKINNLEEFIYSDTKFIVQLIHGDSTDIKGKTHTIKFVSLDDIHEK